MKSKYWLEILGLAMVGEGIVGAFFPKKYSLLWKIGPEPLRNLMEKAAENPETMRLIYAAEATFGFWLAARQFENLKIGEK